MSLSPDVESNPGVPVWPIVTSKTKSHTMNNLKQQSLHPITDQKPFTTDDNKKSASTNSDPYFHNDSITVHL